MNFDVPKPKSDSPIADLSYRNYDGPLQTRAIRWWVIALSYVRLIRSMPILGQFIFWALAVISAVPYLLYMLFLYLEANMGAAGRGSSMFDTALPGQKFASYFFLSFQGSMCVCVEQSIWLFMIGLLIGAGSIANDNAANALQIYLSKPLTKSDYLIGKWMGIFLILFLISLIPALGFYTYCLLTFYDQGFLQDEPWLIGRVILAAAVPAAVHASLLIGFSAWSKTARIAGAFYAAVYFASYTAATIYAGIIYDAEPFERTANLSKGVLARHASIDGVIEGLVQNIYGINMPARGFPLPDLWIMLVAAVLLCMVGIAAARLKIRAVEVVRG